MLHLKFNLKKHFFINYCVLLALSLIFFSFISCNNKVKQPILYDGVIDVSNWDFASNPEIKIKGNGLFYWKQWPIDDNGVFNKTLLSNPTKIKWPSALWATSNYAPKGYGTFRLFLKQSKKALPLVINLGRLLGASEVWINGKKEAVYGVVSKEESMEIPYGAQINLNLPQEDELDIMFIVSSHNTRLGGGPTLQNVIQTKKLNAANKKINPLIEGVITFLIIIFGLFQIYWYLTFNKELYFLYFGLFCLIGVSRQLFVGETIIYNFFPNISFNIVQRMRYIGYFGGLILIILYYNSLYPKYISKNILKILSIIPLVGVVYILLNPIYYGTYIAPFFQLYGLASILIGVYVISKAIRDKKKYAKWVLIILIIQVIAFLNDILTAMLFLHSKYIINYSFLCYIIYHVFLNHKYQSDKERLLNRLYSNIGQLQSDIDYKKEEIETLKKDTFQQIKSKERMVDNLKKVAAADEKVSIQSLIADLKSELLEDNQLINIKNDIEGIHKDFAQRIKKVHPNLTNTDLEICMYIRMSLERKEIARLRYTTVAAVKKARYRLRKKLELELKDSLEAYLKSI